MNESAFPQNPEHIYRIDRFKVPETAGNEFIQNVHTTHEFLKTQPGFVDDVVLEQTGSPGVFNIVTVVVRTSATVLEATKRVVITKHQEIGFSLSELFNRLGIEADLTNYRQSDT